MKIVIRPGRSGRSFGGGLNGEDRAVGGRNDRLFAALGRALRIAEERDQEDRDGARRTPPGPGGRSRRAPTARRRGGREDPPLPRERNPQWRPPARRLRAIASMRSLSSSFSFFSRFSSSSSSSERRGLPASARAFARGRGAPHGGGGIPDRSASETRFSILHRFDLLRFFCRGRRKARAKPRSRVLTGANTGVNKPGSESRCLSCLTSELRPWTSARQGKDHRERVLAVLVVGLAPVRLAESVGGVELARRQMLETRTSSVIAVAPAVAGAPERVLQQPPSLAAMPQPAVRRDLVDVELLVERDREEVPADRAGSIRPARQDTRA